MVTKKYVRIAILLACGVVLALGTNGCKKKPEPGKKTAPVPGVSTPKKGTPDVSVSKKGAPGVSIPKKGAVEGPGKTLVIEPLVGIGKANFGMKVKQMKQILGEPQRTIVPLYEYRDSGFTILAIKDNAITMITCGDKRRTDSPLIKKCSVRTSKGIGIGSSKEDIISAYGQPSSTKQMPGEGNAIMLTYNQLNSDFLLRNDKVTYMMFRAKEFAAVRGRARPPRPVSR